MRLVADDVFQLRGFPPNAFNVYLVEDVLVDAATRFAGHRIFRQIEQRPVAAHALTHAHRDHYGASAKVKERLNIPVLCGAEDVAAAEKGETPRAPHQPGWVGAMPEAPPVQVDRALREGDEVAGFQVLDVPGHSPGHVAYWRESDGTLIAGDVFFNLHPLTGIEDLREPPQTLSYDPERNRESMRRLASLQPKLTLFGHGPPLRDPRKLTAVVEKLGS